MSAGLGTSWETLFLLAQERPCVMKQSTPDITVSNLVSCFWVSNSAALASIFPSGKWVIFSLFSLEKH